MSKREKYTQPFSMIPLMMQEHPAFWSLSPSALRLLVRMIWRNSYAVSSGQKINGVPAFKLTNAEACEYLGMNAATFSRAKNELQEKGFMEWAIRGGLRGSLGEASRFSLSSKWKSLEVGKKKLRSNNLPKRNDQ